MRTLVKSSAQRSIWSKTTSGKSLIARASGIAYTWLCALCIISTFAAAQGPAYPYTVGNKWTLSTTPPALVAGQNLYRAPFVSGICGTWTKLTTTLLSNSATTYTDNISPGGDGQVFCYAASAVGTDGQESTFDIFDPVAVPPAPPTGFSAIVAKNGTQSDVIYAWKNPKGTLQGNGLYCNPPYHSGTPAVLTSFPTSKIRITSPSGTKTCGVTALGINAESGLSNLVKVVVP